MEKIPRWDLPAVNFIETDPDKIQSDILTVYEEVSGRSLARGDPVRLFLLTIAAEIIQLRKNFNTGAQQNLLSYAQNEYLDALGVFLDTARQPATRAVAQFEFTLSQQLAETFVIPAGFQISNGVVTFETTDQLLIPAGELQITGIAQCVEAGVVGNGYLAGQISTIVEPVAFLGTAVNVDETSGGADVEADEDYADRLRLRPNSFSVAGPEKAYIFHAFSVSPSIVDVQVDSPTPGVVNVYTLLNGGELPGEAFLQEVEQYLSSETIRPLTDEVHALAPEAVNYQIVLDYYVLNSDSIRLDEIKRKVEQAVSDFIEWEHSKIGRDINPDELISRVRQAGAARIDHQSLLPNFQVLNPGQVAQCESVLVRFQGLEDG